MTMRIGLGPVFAFEWLAASRRWQGYALRSAFVAALLFNLAVVWLALVAGRDLASIRAQAIAGMAFFVAIAGTELCLVCLVAPAVAAGSLCVDRARGTLAHLMVTDLSDAEIVLGKLAARLVPVVGLVACTLPASALGGLLGGLDPANLVGAAMVTLGCGVGGCAVALMFSVWATRMHEALLATYAVGIVWVAILPAWMVQTLVYVGPPPAWVANTNPFWLIFSPVIPLPPIATGLAPATLADQATFLAGSLLVSAVATALAVAGVRAAAVGDSGRTRRVGRAWLRLNLDGLRRRLPGPTLDGNPVLWREWHRKRPSRWTRTVWGLYAVTTGLITLALAYHIAWAGRMTRSPFPLLFNGAQVLAGLLLLSLSSTTSLAEERAGGLDVLMTTPLTTRQIVRGKWWGCFRPVLWLAIGPALLASALAWQNPEPSRWLGVPLLVGLILAEGAAITSLGLAVATWIPRVGRALGLAVTIYVLVGVGWVFVAVMVLPRIVAVVLASASPFIGVLFLTISIADPTPRTWPVACGAVVLWTVVYTTAALLLYGATVATFNRCLGRSDM